MILFDKVWHFPDGERHLPARMTKWNLRVDGRLTYQYPLYQQGLKACRLERRRVAVDVGAHVGLFSYWMVRDFEQVVAFEPVAAHRACWHLNVPARPQDTLHGSAVGAQDGAVALVAPDPSSSGGTRVVGPGTIPMVTLDSVAIPVVDLLKIDVEGYERDVLRGVVETLQRCKPVVIVEQRARLVKAAGYGPEDAVKGIQKLGGRLLWTDRSDYVLGWV